MPALTVTGNEVTDAVRAADLLLGITASGNMCDGQAIPGGVGIRRAATNLFRRGQCDSLTDWGTTSAGHDPTTSLDATVPPPFSTQSVKYVCDGSVANQGCRAVSGTGLAAAAGTNGVGAIYFRGTAGKSYRLLTRWTNTDASSTFSTTSTFTAGAGAWPTVTAKGLTWEVIPYAALAVAVGKIGTSYEVQVTTNGTFVDTFWVAHAMAESGQSVVAPYVATSGGATATHGAGRVQAPASLLNATQGWVAMRVRPGWDSSTNPASPNSPYLFAWNDGTTNNRIELSLSGAGQFRIIRGSGGVAGQKATGAQVWAAGQAITLVMAWTATQIAISFNGGAFQTLADTHIPAGLGASLDIGTTPLAAEGLTSFDGDVLWLAGGIGTLDASAPGFFVALANHDPSVAGLPAAAQATAAWPADTSTYEIPLALASAPVLS